jgi:SAM-dependent methyltransferase
MRKDKSANFNATLFGGNPKVTTRYQKKYVSYFKKGGLVLDVGCGEGVFLQLLQDSGVNGVGIDSSDEMIQICIQNGLRAEKGDIIRFLDSKHEEFDGIFCSHVIEHFSAEKVIALITSAYKALKTDGILIVITPNFRDLEVISELFWLDITHVRPYPLPLLRELFKFQGFEIVSCGDDKDCGVRLGKRNAMRYFINKIRFGAFYGRGDSFIIGRKLFGD